MTLSFDPSHTHTHSLTHTLDGMFEANSLSAVLRQACGVPGSHVATGRETRCSPPHHQLLEEVRVGGRRDRGEGGGKGGRGVRGNRRGE